MYARVMLFYWRAYSRCACAVDRAAGASPIAYATGRLNFNVYPSHSRQLEPEALRMALRDVTQLRNAVQTALGREAV